MTVASVALGYRARTVEAFCLVLSALMLYDEVITKYELKLPYKDMVERKRRTAERKAKRHPMRRSTG